MKDSKLTRERILAAATEEFAAHGIAGARVDRIAHAAQANKNLLYIYFGSKEQLFLAVLRKHLFAVYETIPFTPNDLPEYAGRLFDFCMDHPNLVRLLTWFGLEQRGEWPVEPGTSLQTKLDAMIGAREKGDLQSPFPPAFLLTCVLSLSSAWTEINPFALSIDPEALSRREELRAWIQRAVRLLSAP